MKFEHAMFEFHGNRCRVRSFFTFPGGQHQGERSYELWYSGRARLGFVCYNEFTDFVKAGQKWFDLGKLHSH